MRSAVDFLHGLHKPSANDSAAVADAARGTAMAKPSFDLKSLNLHPKCEPTVMAS
jgi:hypothetical protein